MQLRALMRRARAQPRQRTNSAAPRVHERAVRGAVLQADRVEAVVQRAHVGGARGHTQRLVVDAMPAWGVGGKRPRAVHWQVLGFRTLDAAAHLEAPVRHRAFNEQCPLDGKRHQEVHALQRRRARRRPRHLEVARAREEDAAVHDVVGDERAQRARSGRA